MLCVVEFLVSVLFIFPTLTPHSRLSALFLTMMLFAHWMRKLLRGARVTLSSILEVSPTLGPFRSTICSCPLTARKGTGRRDRMGETPKIEHRLKHGTLRKLPRFTGDVYLASRTPFSRVLFPCYNEQRHSCHKRLIRYHRLKIVSFAFLLLSHLKIRVSSLLQIQLKMGK